MLHFLTRNRINYKQKQLKKNADIIHYKQRLL